MNKVLVLLLFLSEMMLAQTYENEAIMYSRPGISGTARSIGSAGAYGAVGADLGSVSINPAGIGLYRSTDFSITPGLQIDRNETGFNGTNTNSPLAKIYFNQAGVAFTKLLRKAQKVNEFSFNSTKLVSFTFAINYQRQTMLSRTQNFDGFNVFNSGISAYTDYLNATRQPLNTDHYPIEMVLANAAGLIIYDSINDTYHSVVKSPLNQSGNIYSKGAVDQVDMAFGGNVSDKFYFGAGIGLSILTYQRSSAFSETDTKESSDDFQNYTFTSGLRETGLGVNAKFGIIYRPVSWMRIGLAYHIPTYYSITENYQVNMIANYDTVYATIDASAQPFKYKLHSPMKGVLSTGFFFKEHGFFSIDYEFLNYGSSRFNFGNDYKSISDEVNANEKQTYTFGHVVRAGLEGAYKSLRVRVGYAFSSSPYKKDKFTKGFAEVKHNASMGLGYRGKRFYADFAYIFGMMKDANTPYADFELKNTLGTHNLYLTLGWKINKEAAKASKKESPPKEF